MISDLTMENGAFSYIPGSHTGGRYKSLRPLVIYEGKVPRTLDEQMKTVVPESEWVTPIGGPGTIIFADTSGFHKGGYVLNGRRLLFNAMYNRWSTTSTLRANVKDLGKQANNPAMRWAAGHIRLI
jgi:hypothetical protein